MVLSLIMPFNWLFILCKIIKIVYPGMEYFTYFAECYSNFPQHPPGNKGLPFSYFDINKSRHESDIKYLSHVYLLIIGVDIGV